MIVAFPPDFVISSLMGVYFGGELLVRDGKHFLRNLPSDPPQEIVLTSRDQEVLAALKVIRRIYEEPRDIVEETTPLEDSKVVKAEFPTWRPK